MNPIRKIVIVGGGTAGWLAAAMLGRHLRREVCQIELVESATLGSIGIGESTVPSFVGLLRGLGIDEAEFVRETQATYKLGIKFVDWQRRSEHYFHPFGRVGQPIGSHDFYQCWLRARAEGHPFALQQFSPCSVMAEQGRFFPPDQARNSPIGGANYALHVDAERVAQYLRRYALAKGVIHTEAEVEAAPRRRDGGIEQLVLRDGRRLTGDFYIDCSGFKSILLGQALGVGFENWSQYLPCDRAVVLKTRNAGLDQPYTLATARNAGWSWRIPLRQRVGHGYVYASAFASEAQAKSQLVGSLDGEAIEGMRMLQFAPGRRREFWRSNCLALGLASGFVEPLEATAIHLIARGIGFFLRYFPDRDCDPSLIREYNRRMCADYEEVRDFVMLHYCATSRDDTPFWRWCQTMALPDSLSERIELFRAHGALREGVDELFRASSWQSVFEGMGIRPHKYCPRVENLDLDEILGTLRRASAAIAGMVGTLPSHNDFLNGRQAD